MPKTTATLPERFWAKVAEAGDCWAWTAAKDPASGYGRFQVDRKCKYAHRVAYEMMRAEIPTGLHLDHLCRNRACVNPWHLEPVTSLVNTRRSPIAHGSETHCPKAHPYSGDNLRLHTDKRGYTRRICRACGIDRSAAFHAARRLAMSA